MCRKITKKSLVKIFAAFALTFSLGIAVNFFSGNYTIAFNVNETFTQAEIDALQNKRVINKCFDKNTQLKGTITGSDTYFGSKHIIIHFDQPIYGKYNDLGHDIETYRKCIVEIK